MSRKDIIGILITIFMYMPYLVIAILIPKLFDYDECGYWISISMLALGSICYIIATFIPEKKEKKDE